MRLGPRIDDLHRFFDWARRTYYMSVSAAHTCPMVTRDMPGPGGAHKSGEPRSRV